jgi:hypothetical protein
VDESRRGGDAEQFAEFSHLSDPGALEKARHEQGELSLRTGQIVEIYYTTAPRLPAFTVAELASVP